MKFPFDIRWPLVGLLGCSAALNVVFLINNSTQDTTESEELVAEFEAPVEEIVEEEPVALGKDWKVLHTEVHHSLSKTFHKTGIPNGVALSAVYSRLFMWDLDMRRDLLKGDKIEVVYRLSSDGLPEVAAARFHSKKRGKTYSAFKWQAPGDNFESYWSSDGIEAANRLKNSPLKDYEQVTSLLKDRPNHKGMDFKVPTGTKTVSPKSGVVTRVNFGNYKYNGGCVEVKFSDGVLAKWLHLDSASVKTGQKVSKGTVVGLTGNTGRSTAPHLHYQLDKGRRNIDPIDYHGTIRRSLPSTVMSDFLHHTAPYMNLLDQGNSVAGL